MSARKPTPEPARIEFETFRQIGAYTISNLHQTDPSCFNGDVAVRKYRVTIELIDEPTEVIAARLQQLWDECDNYHHAGPLQVAAKAIGYTLVGSYGSKRKRP